VPANEASREKVVAAAHAAARLARARRATWTDAPLAVPTGAPVVVPPPAVVPPPVVARPIDTPPPVMASREPAPLESPIDEPLTPPQPQGPSIVVRLADAARSVAPAAGRWAPRALAALVLLGAGIAAGSYVLNRITSSQTVERAAPRPTPTPSAAAGRKVGKLTVRSVPSEAQVLVDGKVRGITPLELADVAAGPHTLEVRSQAGSVRRNITVVGGQATAVDESIFPGTLTLFAPFDVSLADGTRALRLDDRNQVMLAPGRHNLRIVNRALAFDAVRQVEVKPGENTTLSIPPPQSTIAVTANEAAEVLVDGARAGNTPLDGFAVDVGTREIVVRRAAGGERRYTVTVTTKPFALTVDFSKPQ